MTAQPITVIPSNSDSLRPAQSGTFEHNPTIRSRTMARRVLVVEDDGALRELIADVFAFEGYFVTEAGNEAMLLESIRRADDTADNHFDLIVLGLQTNGALDIDTLVRLRASGCHTPTVVLGSEIAGPTGRGMIELEASFLSKPFALENLRIVANHVISTQKCRLELLD